MLVCVPRRYLLISFLVGGFLMAAATGRAQNWIKVEAENFTIISSARERDTLAWAREFSQFIAAMQHLVPMDMRRLTPLTVVIFGRDRDFNRYRPQGANGRPLEMAGFFQRRESWSVAALSGASSPEEIRRTIFHEGVHWFMSGSSRPAPVWVEEGVAEVLSTFEMEGGQLHLGHLLPWHVLFLRDHGPMPLDQLMFLQRGFLFHQGSTATGMAYAQSWAFVHFLLYGKHEISRDAISVYLEILHSELHPDEAFRRAFGGDYREIGRQLSTYLHNGTFYTGKLPLMEVAPVAAVRAEPVEVELALARTAVAGRRLPEARAHADKAVQMLPDDPRGYEMLGLVLDETGHREEAIAAYHNAVRGKSRNAQAYFELARTIVPGISGELTAAEARQAVDLYQQSIVFNPFQVMAYRNIAGIVNRLEDIAEHDGPCLEQGRRLYPNDGMIKIGLAVLQRKSGDLEGAHTLLAHVLANEIQDPSMLDYARKLDQFWRHQSTQASIQAMLAERRFEEALALVDEALTTTTELQPRMALIQYRGNLLASVRMEEVRNAWEARRWEEARRLLEEIIASDLPARNKLPARQRLAEMDRRNLGRPKVPVDAAD